MHQALIKSMMLLTIFIERMTEKRIHIYIFMVDYYIKYLGRDKPNPLPFVSYHPSGYEHLPLVNVSLHCQNGGNTQEETHGNQVH
jgi:hypothetical protein